ncbi:MAG: hypothetical protein KBD19_02880 [Candidatus Moranbacteria bacterium]|jgi:hypothetical protein|nr:hypothetical protein [Candidatus Moranbacteria bacterium]
MGQLVPYLMCSSIVYGFYAFLGFAVSTLRWFHPLLLERMSKAYRKKFPWTLGVLLCASVLFPASAVFRIGTPDDPLYGRWMGVGYLAIVGGVFVVVMRIVALFDEMRAAFGIQSHPGVVGMFESALIRSHGLSTIVVDIDGEYREFAISEESLRDSLGNIGERGDKRRVQLFYAELDNCNPRIVFIGWLDPKE